MKTMSRSRSSLLALSLAGALAQAGCASDSMESADGQDEKVGSAQQAWTFSQLANQQVHIYNRWHCDASPADSRCGYDLGWKAGTGSLFDPSDSVQQTPWLLIPVPGTIDQFYIQNKWHCGDDDRCNMNLSWSGTTAQLVDQSDFPSWVPWKFVRVAGTTGQFYLYSRWGCNDQDPSKNDAKCGYYLGFSGMTAKIFPASDTFDLTPWQVMPMNQPVTKERDLAYKFAPRLQFDDSNKPGLPVKNYPMSAESYYEQVIVGGQSGTVENTDYTTVANYANQVPTYYQVHRCGDQIRIMYWWFYGYQHSCNPAIDVAAPYLGMEPSHHNGDWERVMVTVSEDGSQVAAVTYWAHSGHFTRIAGRGGVQLTHGTDPVIYPGRATHASYDSETIPSGFTSLGGCGYWDDPHNTSGSMMDTWNNLVSLDDSAEPWMIADRSGDIDEWGADGVSTHPTSDPPDCSMGASDYDLYKETAYLRSQCKDGDEDHGLYCQTGCPGGYDTYEWTCTNRSYPWDTIDRHYYGYGFWLETHDQCLLTNCND